MGRITCQQAVSAMKDRKKGATMVALSKKLGISESSLRTWMRRYEGMNAKQIKLSKSQDRKLLLLRRTVKVLEAKLALSRQFIKDLVPSRRRRARYALSYRSQASLSKTAVNHIFGLVHGAGGAVRPITDGDEAVKQMRDYLLKHPGHGLERMVEAGAICGPWSKRELRFLYCENHMRVDERPRAQKISVPRAVPAASLDTWAMDYVMGNLADGSRYWVLNVMDEFDRRCIASEATKQPNAMHLLRVLNIAVSREGKPKSFRSDHGAQFTGRLYTSWLWQNEIAPRYTGKVPWKDNGLCERLNLTVRNEVIDVMQLGTLPQVQHALDRWRRHYNGERIHGTLKTTPDAFARAAKTRAGRATSRLRSSPP